MKSIEERVELLEYTVSRQAELIAKSLLGKRELENTLTRRVLEESMNVPKS